jgi:hypothetical protein
VSPASSHTRRTNRKTAGWLSRVHVSPGRMQEEAPPRGLQNAASSAATGIPDCSSLPLPAQWLLADSVKYDGESSIRPAPTAIWRTAELGLARGLLGSRRRLLGTVFAPLGAGVGEFALWRRRICQNNAEKR